jgi:transcriptional regulator with XRE-family HTH domain
VYEGVGLSENTKDVGRRIRMRREGFGWSQGDLAARLGRTQTTVSYWETGKHTPGVDDFITLARVLDVGIADLFPPVASQRPLPAVLRAIAQQIDGQRLLEDLMRFLMEAEAVPRPSTRLQARVMTPRDTAESLLVAAGVYAAPVAVETLAHGCGVKVLPWDFAEPVDGLIMEPSGGPVIGVNRRQALVRQRFTLAHELGHYVLRHADTVYLDFGGDLSPTASGVPLSYSWRHERDATEFAANLLMPAALLAVAVARTTDVAELSRQFQVSAAAMGFRLDNLRLS